MAQTNAADRHAWEDDFLAALRQLGTVIHAASAAGITTGAPYNRRKRSARFAAAWEAALEDFRMSGSKTVRNSAAKPAPMQWKRAFLDTLAETSNVAESARQAGVSPREVYRTRRDKEEFAADWRAALFEGYANLEMEVLGYLRDPAPERKMDVAAALRLLAAHKDSVAAERGQCVNVSAAEVRASIARKVDALRQQVLAERAAREQSGDE